MDDRAALSRAIADAIRHDPVFAGPIRGSITLADSGADIPSATAIKGAGAATISWRSSNPAVIADTDRRAGRDLIRKGAVTRGPSDTAVRLTATVAVPGAAPVVVPVDLTVLARPATIDPTAYAFVYFTGNTVEGEKLRFAVSDGDNALQWKDLNDAQPILESTEGTRGLRDPFIMRSAEGDRFFLLATDLSTGRTGWGGSTDHGSQHLEIWESTDLVHWGRQRHVKVNLPNAGMTWAPEASYDPTIDAYVVYWTSTLFTDAAHKVEDGNGPQILTAITRDFRTFTRPEPWFKAADLPILAKKKGMIDATVLKDGDHYYRFTKVTEAKGCPSGDIIAQRSRSLRATAGSGAWSLVDRCIGRHAGTPEVEGPSAFVANKGDISGFRYYLWVDNYGGVGYIPLATNSLHGKVKWTYPAKFRLPASPRHGSVLAITARERDALAARWDPSLLASTPSRTDDVSRWDDAWIVPPVVASGTRLPSPVGRAVVWQADGATVRDGVLTNNRAAATDIWLTGRVTTPGGKAVVKRFRVKLLGADARRLISYARTPTSAHEANQPVVARSLHLALGRSDTDAQPLNDNYGVQFAIGDYTGVDRVALRGIANPSLFYFADGGLGVIASRVDMDGAADAASSALIFKADPASPTDFKELGPVDLRTSGTVVAPRAVWDSAAKQYVVSWQDRSGSPRWTTVKDLARTERYEAAFFPTDGGRRSRVVLVSNVGETRSGAIATIDAAVAPTFASRASDAEAAAGLPVSVTLATALANRFGRIVNTSASVAPVVVAAGNVAAATRARVQLGYSDGSTATRAVDWDAADIARLTTAARGTYTVHGTVRQPAYPAIFAYERADPTIYRYERGGVTKYLFIATDDTNNDNVGSQHLPIRVADSIAALADANGGRAREIDLLNRRTRRNRTKEGRVIAGCYWAPELHEIGGRLSILFAPCFNPKDDQSNENGTWFTVESHIMQLRDGGDPANPADWGAPAAVRQADGSKLGRAGFPNNISLDMSSFEAGGQTYYTWSQRYLPGSGTLGDPLTWIAKVDPSSPTRLLSTPRPIVAPDLSFEENLAEGGFTIHHDGRVQLVYSSSGVSPTYVVGGVWAKEDADLTDIDNWHKWQGPLQKSVPMPKGVTDYRTYEQGPGHGAFTTDADGNALYVYHTWGHGVGGNGRDTRVRRLHWAQDGRPVLDMTPEEEVAPASRAVTMRVTVR